MGPIDGHQWSIDGHRWGFYNDDPIDGSSMDHRWLIDGPSMTHRWESKFFITKIRSTWPCSKFQQNFGILSFSFSQFKLCLGFRWCPNILFGNEVIHSYPYYLPLWKTGFCWFSKENPPNFLIQKRILRVKFLHISDHFSSYKQMVFSAIEARFRRIFMRIIAILPGFSTFSNNSRTRLRYKWLSGSRKLAQAQKEMRVG